MPNGPPGEQTSGYLHTMYWEGEQELPVNFEIVSGAPERARAVLA